MGAGGCNFSIRGRGGMKRGGGQESPPSYPDSCREFSHQLRSRIVPAEKGGVWERAVATLDSGTGMKRGGQESPPSYPDSRIRRTVSARRQAISSLPRSPG